MALTFLSRLQVALLSVGYTDVILRVKQVIYLEAPYLRKDLLAALPTGYGKSLVFHVLPRLLKERDKTLTSPSSTCNSVVLVVSPLNALMYDQISSLREKAMQAAILGVKEAESDDDGDSPFTITSQWEGTRGRIIQAEYEIVFSHPEAFLSCEEGLEVL